MGKTFAFIGIVVAILGGLVLFFAGCGAIFHSGQRADRIYTQPVVVPHHAALPSSPSDFTVDVTIIGKRCFGSSGCIYDYTLDPKYVGSGTPGSATVVFEIRGASEPRTDHFTVDDSGDIDIKRDDHIDAEDGATLTAVVTQVIPR